MRTTSALRTILVCGVLTPVLCIGGVACSKKSSSGSAGKATTTTTAAATTTTGAKTTTTAGSSTSTTSSATSGLKSITAAAGGSDIAGFLKPLLMTPSEVASTFTASPASTTDGPTPCGLDLDATFHPTAETGVVLTDSGQSLTLQEKVRVFADTTTAASAYAGLIGPKGLGCATSTDGSTTIGKGQDVATRVGGARAGDIKAMGFPLTQGTNSVLGFTVLYQDALITFEFAGPTSVTPKGISSPIVLTAAGMSKILDGVTS